jgi:hypothetical protein
MEVQEIKTRQEALQQGLNQLHIKYNNAILKQEAAIEECGFWINRLEKQEETEAVDTIEETAE